MQNKKILEVVKLNKYFSKSGKLVKILDNISFDVYEKDFLGIIGESGSGKSTTGKCIIRLYSSSSGNIIFDNNIINQKRISKKTKKWLYQNMSMIFQDPMSSLNPRKNVLTLVSEPLVINKTIKQDALKLISNCHRINSFFKNTYKQQDYQLTNDYVLTFYHSNIELFKYLAEQIAALSPNASSLEVLKNILIDMESNYKASLNIYANYVDLIKTLYKLNSSNYDLKNLEDTEIKYQDALEYKDFKKKMMQAPQEYWDLNMIREKLISDMQTFINDNNIKYHEQNYNRIKAIKTKYSSEIKSLKQQAALTNSITENIYSKVSVQILKDTLRAVKLISKDIYVEQHELENFSNFINNKISEKYIDIINDINSLGKLSEEIDKLLDDTMNSEEEEIRQRLMQYDGLYKKVKEELVVLKRSNPLDENTEVINAIEKMKNVSQQKASRIKYEQVIQKLNIKKIKKELKEIKDKFIRTYDDLPEQEYHEAKRNFDIAKMTRHEFDQQANDNFKKKDIPLIKEQKKYIKKLTKELSEHQKVLKEVVLNKLKTIKKILKENKVNKNSEYKILMNEIKIKLQSISAINFEVETYNQDISLYRRLRSRSLVLLLLNLRYLKQSLTRDYVYKALDEVGLKNEHAYRYPHEFSGGQRQRIVIARALISKPKLVIADEPISALDVSIQAQVINIMKSLAEKYDITFLFIAHDLSMVRYTSNRLIILHKGRIVEKGNTEEVFNNPIHPYTKSLIKASPELSKIHINLASFSSKMDYDKDYSPNNEPQFFKVENESEHYVFATEEQFWKWIQK